MTETNNIIEETNIKIVTHTATAPSHRARPHFASLHFSSFFAMKYPSTFTVSLATTRPASTTQLLIFSHKLLSSLILFASSFLISLLMFSMYNLRISGCGAPVLRVIFGGFCAYLCKCRLDSDIEIVLPERHAGQMGTLLKHTGHRTCPSSQNSNGGLILCKHTSQVGASMEKYTCSAGVIVVLLRGHNCTTYWYQVGNCVCGK